MAPTYSSRLRALLQEYNTNPESWGGELNLGALEILDAGWATTEVAVEAEVTLTSQQALADQSRGLVLILSGSGGFAVITPAVDKPYLVINNCAADVTMKPSGGTAATIRAGIASLYYTNAAGTIGYVVDPTLDKIKPAAADVAMGSNKITGLADPTSAQDASTKAYADTKLPLAGGTMTGAIAMGTAKITGLGDPTADQDAATKAYVVSQTATSVAAAAASAAAALVSEGNAAISETNAVNAWDYFDDRYLGAKASDPIVDNDGDPLVTGALYWNTAANETRAYNGVSWQAAASGVNGTLERQVYTATAAQTTFAITYDVGFVDVWLNGVKLLAGTDFTAATGTNIVLAVGATSGDIVDIIAFGAFEVANTVAPSRQVIAGTGLTGGGDLSTNVTLNLAENFIAEIEMAIRLKGN
jgi:hypothetical protein